MENTNQSPKPKRYESPKYLYKKSSCVEMFDVLHSLLKNEFFCDIKLETDDKKIISAHKVILASASPYFHAMFTNFSERNHDVVVMRQFNSTALQILVTFIYSGEIVVSGDNVHVLLPAADLLQLLEVKEACCDFLQSQLYPLNCIDINRIADLHSCTQLMESSELYMQQHFSEIVDDDKFLSLSCKQVIKLISSDKLIVESEEKVFESVVRWVKHDFDSRNCMLPQLMEHVRLPLTPKDYILKNVSEEPLIKNCIECLNYILEALHFHILKSDQLIPQNTRNKPRHGDKIIFILGGGIEIEFSKRTEWYDPKVDRWFFGPEMITSRHGAGVGVVNDNFVFAVGGYGNDASPRQSIDVMDISSEALWKPSVDMLVKRAHLGVSVINNHLYAVGGYNSSEGLLDSAEVFDFTSQKWRMIASMITAKSNFGMAVMNNLIYAVGGCNRLIEAMDIVECYHPSLDKWVLIPKMSVGRKSPGVGVLDGVLYVVGGYDGLNYLSSVETYTPSTGVWTFIKEMNSPRQYPGVVVMNGLLYAIGGDDKTSFLDSTEYYDPKTDTWTMVAGAMTVARSSAAVVAINRPRNFNTC